MDQLGQRKNKLTFVTNGFFRAILTSLVLALFLQAPLALFVGSKAYAQSEEKPQTLFRLLFGDNEPKKPVAAAPPKPRASTSKQQRAGTVVRRAPAVAAEPEIVAVEKSENAKRILVVGDFTAGATAKGLEDAYLDNANVIIIPASNGSSGLVRDDFYDWNVELPNLIETEKPDIVVLMIGANDRQQMMVSGNRESVRSDAWVAEYRARIRRIATLVTAANTPLVWIGQLPYQASTMMSDMLLFNDIYRDIAEQTEGANFVDIWEGFVDENGNFVSRGPDINGQIVALRSGKVNVTKAGARKIAFYAERTLRDLIGEGDTPIEFQLGPENLPVLSLNGPNMGNLVERIRPVSINSTTLDGGDELLGATVQKREPAQIVLKPVAGRINDFAIAPVAASPTVATPTEQDVN